MTLRYRTDFAAVGPRRRVTAGVVVMLVVLAGMAGCSRGPAAATRTPTSPSAHASSTGSPIIPVDGIGLRGLGIANGPVQFSVPLVSRFRTDADQPQEVTLVFTTPTPAEVQAYLQRTLPASGFTISTEAKGAIVFSGYGWGGSFVITGSLSAVTLQNQDQTQRTGG